MNASEADEASVDVVDELCKGDFLNWSPADMAEARRRIAAVLLRRGTRAEPLALALVEPRQPRDWPADWQEQFWGAYPRRVGKGDAMRRLEKIRMAGKVPFQQILNAALVYRTETQNVEMQYIAHPATWLNRGRWEDDPGAIAGRHDDGRGEMKNGFLGRFMDRR